MAYTTILTDKIAAGERLIRLISSTEFKPSSAYWAKIEDSDNEKLYITSPGVDEHGPFAAYSSILRLLSQIGDSAVSSDDIVLMGEKYDSRLSKERLHTYSLSDERLPRITLSKGDTAVFTSIPMATTNEKPVILVGSQSLVRIEQQ